MDTLDVPNVAYINQSMRQLMYASRSESGWQGEIVENNLKYFNPSLIIDKDNIPHLSYCRRDSVEDKTYLCYARRPTGGWEISIIDSCGGILGYWEYFTTSINLDTFGLPGIVYTPWNVSDSIHYVKYSHFNGTNWDTSVVEYDSAYSNIQPWPTDQGASLKYSNNNIPMMAFYQSAAPNDPYNDTIKYAYFDDTLNKWIVSPVKDSVAGMPSISLALDSMDRPAIAYCFDGILAYAYWNDLLWETELITSIGWTNISIALIIDTLNKPHIAFTQDPLYPSPDYCYKDSGGWHFYIPLEDSIRASWCSLVLDRYSNSHTCYRFENYGVYNGLRYAKGTCMGIDDFNGNRMDAKGNFTVFPNPTRGLLNIAYRITKPTKIEITLFDATGSRVKLLKQDNLHPGCYRDQIEIRDLTSGVYFIVLKQNDEKVCHKFLQIK